MSWLQRLFGMERPSGAQVSPTPSRPAGGGGGGGATAPAPIPPERMGLNGEYDESGLAKRVALAFDQNPELTNLDNVWVAQLGTVIVLKGKVPDQATLQKLIAAARDVAGTTGIETNQVMVGR